MRRRELLAVIGLGTCSAKALSQAVQPRRLAIVLPVGRLHPSDTPDAHPMWRTFFAELRRRGWNEGRNLVVERHSAGGQTARYAEVAREVVRSNPDVILALSARLVEQFKTATNTIPIVAHTADPVAYGFAASLAHPGGNITGVSVDAGLDVWAKHIEHLSSVVPGLQNFGFVAPQSAWQMPQGRAVQQLAEQMKLIVVPGLVEGSFSERSYRQAFENIRQNGAQALLVGDHAEHLAFVRLIVDLAGAYRLPASYPFRDFVDGGGLMAYAPNLIEYARVGGEAVARILQGEKASDIPFQQPTTYTLIFNLRTAKALNLTIPPTLLARADEVIE